MLSSPIPMELEMLLTLKVLLLSQNTINGKIPSSFDKFQNLEALELHGNMLSGEVSEKICDISLHRMTAVCLAVETEVSCSCCTNCY